MKIIVSLLALYVYANEPQTEGSAAKPDAKKAPAAQASKAPTAPEDSPLVKAAKAAKAAKEGKAGAATASKPKVIIDDETVKSSKGKLIYIKDTPLPKLEPAPPSKTPAAAKNPVALAAQAEAKLKTAQKEVESLELELTRLENEFYEEGDPNYRQDVIENRFNKTTKQLDIARQKLTDAREEYNDLSTQAATRNPNP